MDKKIPLSSSHLGGNEINFIKDALTNNWIAPKGPNVDGFEEDLSNYLGNNHFVTALSSGTAALHLALLLLGVKDDDEVICQSMTFSATANPITYVGAKPIFIDSEINTWNLNPKYVEEAILDRIKKGKKPKAIIAVHLYGMPFNVMEIKAISTKYNIPIIEDAAEALGSSFENKKCGTFGDIAILSFNGNKIITTSGGGALISKNESHKEKAIFLATQARDEAPHYQHSEIGYNYRMSNICAGIGRGQMEVLDTHITLRREINSFYKEIFQDVEGITVFTEPTTQFKSNHWLSCILIDSSKTSITADQIRLSLLKDNIEARPLWKPMHLQPIFKDALFFGDEISKNLFHNGLCLPSGSNLNSDDRDRIKKSLINILS